MSASGQTKPSADAFPQVGLVIQPVDLHPKEITSRDDAPNPSALDDRKMTKTAIAHLTQCVYCAIIGSDGNWIGRHRLRQRGRFGVLAFGKRALRPDR